MILYHQTTQQAAANIVKGGFRDSTRKYFPPRNLSGVFLSKEPIEEGNSAHGDTLLKVDVQISPQELGEWEPVEKGKTYLEFLIPARILNPLVKRIWTKDNSAPKLGMSQEERDQWLRAQKKFVRIQFCWTPKHPAG